MNRPSTRRRRWADRLLGIRGAEVTLRFRERSWLEATLPDDARWTLSRELLLLRSYEDGGVRLADCTGVVIDAGAHAGLLSLMASQHARYVVAIEPHPVLFGFLTANAAHNQAAVEALPRALWSEHTRIRFNTAMPNSMLSTIDAAGTVEVETITLAELVQAHGEIDLLKLDIEGAEWQVLMTADVAVLARIHRIAGEMHYRQGDEARREQLAARLRSQGFDVLLSPARQYRPGLVGRVLRNGSCLQGHLLMKAALLLYLLFPAPKPLLPAADALLTSHFFAIRR